MPTPRSKAACASAAVASVCPQETVTPRSLEQVDELQRSGQFGRQRHVGHRACREQPFEQLSVGIAPRGRGMRSQSGRRQEGAFEVDAEDARTRLLAQRHLPQRREQ